MKRLLAWFASFVVAPIATAIVLGWILAPLLRGKGTAP